jgi:CHAT domain-containing protein
MRLVMLIITVVLVQAQDSGIQSLIDEAKSETGNGHFDAAERMARRAIDTSRAAQDRKGETAGYMQLSSTFFYARKLPEAIEAARQAQNIASAIPDDAMFARALGLGADALRDSGKLAEAKAAYERQLELLRKTGDRRAQAINLRMTAILYRNSGDLARAMANSRQALTLFRELHDQLQTGNTLHILGVLESDQELYSAALEHFNEALTIPELTAVTRTQVERGIGTAQCGLEHYAACIVIMRQLLDQAIASGNQHDIAWGYFKLGYPQSLSGAHREAYESNLKALATLRSTGHDPYEEWHFLASVGQELAASGRQSESLLYYKQAIAIVEWLREGLVPTEESMAKAATAYMTKDLFDQATDALFGVDPVEALRTVELARARAFLSILAESKINLREGIAPALRAREAELFKRVTAIRTTDSKAKTAELNDIENNLEDLHVEMRKANPKLAQIQYPQPLGADQIRQSLRPGTTLIEYALGPKRSFAWVLSRDKVTAAVLPPAKEIEAQVAALRRSLTAEVSGLTARQAANEAADAAAKLSRTLLKPIESSLAGSRQLIIVPDGALYYVPLEVLPVDGKTLLLQRYPVAYAVSASTLAEGTGSNMAVAYSRELLAFGDPVQSSARNIVQRGFELGSLPFTRDEVKTIAAQFPPGASKVYLGGAARLESIESEALDRYRYLHFATHGLLDEEHPSQSGVVLTAGRDDDGVLRFDAVTGLRLNAEVVTLSACNTGLGKLVSGEGMLGLVRAFLYAGAASVNVSLWSVNDAATADLMKEFYRNLRRSMTPAESLRQAKLTLLGQDNTLWRHPHYWAPFVLWLR